MRNRTNFFPGLRVGAFLSCTVSLAAGGLPALAQNGIYTPKVGSAERKAIMNAFRIPVEQDLRRNASPAAPLAIPRIPILFVIVDPRADLRVKQDWAFVRAILNHPDGRQLDYDTPVAAGLLHRVHGRWHVIRHETGGEEEPWTGWGHQYHAPPDLIPKAES